jgi:putative PEP-CTERM system histidine kinase
MIATTWFAVLAFLAAGIAGGMATLLFARDQTRSLHRSLAALLGAIAVANLANGIGLLDGSHTLLWRGIAIITELFVPAALLYVGLAFLNPPDQDANISGLWRARVVGVVGGFLALLEGVTLVVRSTVFENGQAVIALASWGHLRLVFIIIGIALGLAQLELVLRASREPIRHRLKFIVIGLGGLAGYQIYQASHMLLFPVWGADYVLVSSSVTIMSLSLVAYGLVRSRLKEMLINTYVSQQALIGSVTFIVIGVYLLAVGAVGEWLRHTNQPLGFGLSIVAVFGALVGMAIAAFSKTVRGEIRRFLTRNFYRSKYDYRAKWLQVTESFEGAIDKEAIMDRLLDILIKTFNTRTLSVWVLREADRRFSRIRSMTTDTEPVPLELSHPVIVNLLRKDEPVIIDRRLDEKTWIVDDPLRDSDVALCFPIRAQGKLIAFIALGSQLHGENYGTHDCDLLRGICHHVAALLSHANLAEERQAAAELEALHRFSVFCLHDLKNLASRLSLVAQNAERHGRDPAFQQSVIRTVTDTAKKMTELTSKLSLKSFELSLAGTPGPVDLLALIEEVIGPLRAEKKVRLKVVGTPVRPVSAVRDQIQQVLLNVVLNAKQAISGVGTISIGLAEINSSAVLTIEDTGRGIPPAMLDTLFRLSKSKRPGGLGVGLYQCKQIIEAHLGTIQIRSEHGNGTQVRITLPLIIVPTSREKVFGVTGN